MKFFTNEVKIAIVAIVGIVLLYFGLNFLKGISLFSANNTYYVKFTDISGLTESSPVYAKGYQVGLVRHITYDYTGSEGILVELDVDKNLRMPEGATGEIVNDIMGNVQMNLVLPEHGHAFLEPGDTLGGNINEGVSGAVAKLVPDVQHLLPKLDSILSSVNTLAGDPALTRSLHNAEKVSANLAVTTQRINSLLAGVNYRLPQMMDKTDEALDKVNTTFQTTAEVASRLAALDIEGTMSKVDHTLANVQRFTDRLNSNEGTLGLLLNDPSLYHNLNSAVVGTDTLVRNLKAHPKRYVHFSIFGRKDK